MIAFANGAQRGMHWLGPEAAVLLRRHQVEHRVRRTSDVDLALDLVSERPPEFGPQRSHRQAPNDAAERPDQNPIAAEPAAAVRVGDPGETVGNRLHLVLRFSQLL